MVMTNEVRTYKDLIAWQKAIALVTDIYKVTRTFPSDEKFGLISQLNRAAVSVPSNIAEGWGRETQGNYLQFLRNSRGSLMEIQTQFIIAMNLDYITPEQHKLISEKCDEVGRILQGLIKSINVKKNLTESV
jgi:four helix bundle protein